MRNIINIKLLTPLLTWLEDLIGELSDHLGDKLSIRICEERNRSHQRTTVEEDYILNMLQC